jgi:hypothetical protein
MRIESYGFGKIVIEGSSYTKDVIVLPGRVLSPWWRREGHSLEPADLEEVVGEAPEVLVVGTGAMGVMKVPDSTVSWLGSKGIEVRAMRTGSAVEEFNALSASGRKAAAALHLTC